MKVYINILTYTKSNMSYQDGYYDGIHSSYDEGFQKGLTDAQNARRAGANIVTVGPYTQGYIRAQPAYTEGFNSGMSNFIPVSMPFGMIPVSMPFGVTPVSMPFSMMSRKVFWSDSR